MLFTRPFLTESIAVHIKATESNLHNITRPCTATDSNRVMVNACVDSAVRTIEVLQVLQKCHNVPKHLPFVINSVFDVALVLGFAHFGDLHRIFLLERSLKTVLELFAQFSGDSVARRNADVIANLATYFSLNAQPTRWRKRA